MAPRRRILTFALLAVSAAAALPGVAHAGNREAWPRLWSQPWIAGESAAVLHEEVAPGIWTIYLRAMVAPNAFHQAGLFQELERHHVEDMQALEVSYRVGDAAVQGALEVETALVAAEVMGDDSEPAWFTASVTTIHYELTIDHTVRVYRMHHLDLLNEYGSAARAQAALATLVAGVDAAGATGSASAGSGERGRVLRLDGDRLQLCLQGAAACINNDSIEGRLNILCCVSAMLSDRARVLARF